MAKGGRQGSDKYVSRGTNSCCNRLILPDLCDLAQQAFTAGWALSLKRHNAAGARSADGAPRRVGMKKLGDPKVPQP